ncbi:hypothetical protein KBC40_02220 [Patescibacteria group bacterium]|nr:hypothetical protein [Patescibacteria group bacterium]
MFKQKKAILIKLLLLLLMWSVPILGGYEDLIIVLMLLIFAPILVLFFYRLNKNVSIEKLNKVFRFFVWFFILFYLFGLGHFFITEYPYDMTWWTMEDTLGYIVSPILNLIILSIMLKVNTFFIPREKSRLIASIKNNKETAVAIVAIILALALALTLWFGSEWGLNRFIAWSNGEVSDIFINDTRNFAIKKIVVSCGLIFTSAFLLIYSFKKK